MSAFLQQAEANLALLSAQLEGRRASPRRRAVDEGELRDQLTVQARTMLSRAA